MASARCSIDAGTRRAQPPVSVPGYIARTMLYDARHLRDPLEQYDRRSGRAPHVSQLGNQTFRFRTAARMVEMFGVPGCDCDGFIE